MANSREFMFFTRITMNLPSSFSLIFISSLTNHDAVPPIVHIYNSHSVTTNESPKTKLCMDFFLE